MTLLKWWKNKDYCIFVITAFLSVLLAALSAVFIVDPYNIILVFLICFIGGTIMRHKKNKLINNLVDKLNKKH